MRQWSAGFTLAKNSSSHPLRFRWTLGCVDAGSMQVLQRYDASSYVSALQYLIKTVGALALRKVPGSCATSAR